jgi:hypothetical protein
MHSPLLTVFFKPVQNGGANTSPLFAVSVATPVNCVLDEEQLAFVEAVFSRYHVASPAARDRHPQT